MTGVGMTPCARCQGKEEKSDQYGGRWSERIELGHPMRRDGADGKAEIRLVAARRQVGATFQIMRRPAARARLCRDPLSGVRQQSQRTSSPPAPLLPRARSLQGDLAAAIRAYNPECTRESAEASEAPKRARKSP